MRLIDADKLEEELHDYIGNYSGRTWFEIRDILGEAEEVKAIPTAWVISYIRRRVKENDGITEEAQYISSMLSEWEKENEID